MPTKTVPSLDHIILEDFSGGWNSRDAASQVANNESPECLNVTLDVRGGFQKRLGLTRVGSGTTIVNPSHRMFYWQKTGETIIQDGAVVRKTTDFTSFTTLKTYSTSAGADFCDFQGKLVAVHPVDKVSVYDSATWTDIGTSPKGSTNAAWQNKVFVGGDPDNPSRVWWSNAGDPNTWTLASAFVDLREKDNALITAIGGGTGLDDVGRGGLLVFKADSTYRIHDSGTGAFVTLHNEAGAGGPMCVATSTSGVTAFISKKGIYVTDSVSKPELASNKIDPLFRATEINFSKQDIWCAGVHQDRFVFSLTRGVSQTTNNFTLEYHPALGWIVPHSFGLASAASFGTNDFKLYGASTSLPRIYSVFSGGSDDGTAITARFQTRWFEPGNGYNCRLRKLLVNGRGIASLYVKRNYSQGVGDLYPISVIGSGFVWDSGTWGSGVWGPDLFQDFNLPFYALGIARAVSFEVQETSSITVSGPPLLDDGAVQTVGAFAVYALYLDFVNLRYS